MRGESRRDSLMSKPGVGRRVLVGTAIGLGAAVLAISLAASGLGTRIELKTYDWRMRQTARPAGAGRRHRPRLDRRRQRAADGAAGRTLAVAAAVHAYLIDFLRGAGQG